MVRLRARWRRGTDEDVVGVGGEEVALGAGEVVLGQGGDLLEEAGAGFVVEEPGGERFLGGSEAAAGFVGDASAAVTTADSRVSSSAADRGTGLSGRAGLFCGWMRASGGEVRGKSKECDEFIHYLTPSKDK